MSAKKYLVTGGTGFLGSAIVKKLVVEGNQVRVLDNNSRGDIRRLGPLIHEIEMVNGDIRDSALVHRAVAGVDSVLHLAYINGTEYFYKYPELVLDIGIRGFLNVIDACRSNSVAELVLASSSEVYQLPPLIPTPENVPLSVPDPRNPRYSYGGGKIINELMLFNYGKDFFGRVIAFRPHNIYGPDMGTEHVIPQFSIQCGRLASVHTTGSKAPFLIQGSGEETRSFMYIDDFAQAIDCVLKNGEHREIYHIGVRDEITIADLARRVASIAGIDISLIKSEVLSGSVPRRCPDPGKLNSLGFVPRFSLDEGLVRTVPWYLQNLHSPVRTPTATI